MTPASVPQCQHSQCYASTLVKTTSTTRAPVSANLTQLGHNLRVTNTKKMSVSTAKRTCASTPPPPGLFSDQVYTQFQAPNFRSTQSSRDPLALPPEPDSHQIQAAWRHNPLGRQDGRGEREAHTMISTLQVTGGRHSAL